MTDKKKKFEEMSVFIKDFDERVSSQWEQWKNELYYKLETMCETEEELDELVEHLKKVITYLLKIKTTANALED